MDLNDTANVEIKIDVGEIEVDHAADPLCIEAGPMKKEDCTWDLQDFTLALDSQPDNAGLQFLRQALLGEPGCLANNAIKGSEVATDPLRLESEVLPKIEDPLKQEDCSQDPPTDVYYENETNQEKGTSHHEVIVSNQINLKELGTGEIQRNVASFSKYTQNNTKLLDINDKLIKCDECGRFYINIFYLILHKTQVHRSNELCGTLNASINNQTNSFKCDQCERSFTDIGLLWAHKTKMHQFQPASEILPSATEQPTPNTNSVFKCDLCEKLFTHNHFLEAHKTKMHQFPAAQSQNIASISGQPNPNINSVFKCDQCEKTFSKISKLQYHKTRKHTSKVTERSTPAIIMHFKCDECEGSFGNEFSLQKHKVKVHPSKEASERLASILAQANPSDLEFKCHYCVRSFTNDGSLRVHYTLTHLSKEEREKEILLRRRWKTNKTLDFKCDQCLRSFTRDFYLQVHKSKIHKAKDARENFADVSKQLNPNPNSDFKCDECERTFSTRGNLKLHKTKKHLSKEERDKITSMRKAAKVFRCDHCERLYSHERSLLLHRIKMHQFQVASESVSSIAEQPNPNLDSDKKELQQKGKKVKTIAHFKQRFICNMCKRPFLKKALRHHKIKYHRFGGSKQPAIVSKVSECEKCNISFPYLIPYLCHDLIDHQSRFAITDLKSWTSRLPPMPSEVKSRKSEAQPLNDEANASNGCNNCLSRIPHKCHLKDDKSDNKCQYCCQSFDSPKSFREHLFTHPQYFKSTCVFCETKFSSKEKLVNHLSANTCPRLQCKICFEYVFSGRNIMEHKKRHPEDRNVKCNLCPKVLKNRFRWKMHMKICHSKLPAQCPVCSKLFHTKNLKRHITQHSCKICGLKFAKIGDPANRKHILTHYVSSKDRSVTCDICSKKLCNKETLKGHMSLHFRDQRIKCQQCESTFSQSTALKYHMRTRHVSEKKFMCELCGMSYAEEIDLSIHKLRRHEIQPTNPIPEMQERKIFYKCSLCPKKFALKRGLSDHILVEHNTDSEEVLVCDVCAMVFIKRNDLKLHWLKHTYPEILQNHFCKKCKKLFIQNVVADQSSSPTENQSSFRCVCKVNLRENENSNSNLLESDTAKKMPDEVSTDCVFLSSLGVVSQQVVEDGQFPSEGPIGGGEVLEDTAAAGDLDLMVPVNAVPDVLLDVVLPNELLDTQKEPGFTECKICNITFATELELDSHRQNHWDLKLTRKEAKLYGRRIKTHGEGSYTCNRCSKKFFVRNEFKHHLKAVILNLDGTLTCDQKKVYRNHLRKPLPCETCGKSFSTMVGFYSHMRTHPNSTYNIKPVKCRLCPATFRHKSSFSTHMKYHKNGKKPIPREPLPCSTCGKTFTTKTGLGLHRRTHAKKEMRLGEPDDLKRRTCDICSATFSRPADCSRHMKYHKKAIKPSETNITSIEPIALEPLPCETCGKTFATLTGLGLHRRTHAKKETRPGEADDLKQKTCSICLATFSRPADCIRHMKSHEKAIKPSETNIKSNDIVRKDKSSSRLAKMIPNDEETCISTVKLKPELNRPLRTYQKDKMVCSVCNGTFTSTALQLVEKWRQSIMYRMPTESNLTTNATAKPIMCATCSAGSSVDNAESLSHMLEEADNEHTEMNATFSATPESTHHLFFHTYAQDLKKSIVPDSEPKSMRKCNNCNETFTTKSGLLSHLKSHETIKKSTGSSRFLKSYEWSDDFLCDVCGRYIPNRTAKLHMRKHSGISCDLCKESFSCTQRLKDHLRIHMRAMHFRCNVCSKFFKIKSQLTNHLTLDHNIPFTDIDYSKHRYIVPIVARYKCKDCGLDYCDQGSLYGHQLTQHSNAPPIKCDVCNRTFARDSNLRRHMVLHSSKRGDLECDFCKLRFLNRHKIEVHMKHHTHEKPFKCDQCSAKFEKNFDLKKHMYSHSNVRNFVCELCGRKYKRKMALAFHMNSHMEKDDV